MSSRPGVSARSAGRTAGARAQCRPPGPATARGGYRRLLETHARRCPGIRSATVEAKRISVAICFAVRAPAAPETRVGGWWSICHVAIVLRRLRCPRLSRLLWRPRGLLSHSTLTLQAVHAFDSRRGGSVLTGRPRRIFAKSLLILMSFPSAPFPDAGSAGGDGLRPPEITRGLQHALRLPVRVRSPGRSPYPSTGAGGAAYGGGDGNSLQFALPLAQLKRPEMSRAYPSHNATQSVGLRGVGLLTRPCVPRPTTGNGPNSVLKTQKGGRIVAVSSKCFKPLKKSRAAGSRGVPSGFGARARAEDAGGR
jgi:hypothetical protein